MGNTRHRFTYVGRARPGARFLLLLVLAALALWPFAGPTAAQQLPNVLRSAAEKQDINQLRVGIVTGLPGGMYAKLGTEISQLVENDPKNQRPPFRVIVQIGLGSVRNLDDLLNLRNVDFALLQSDVVEAYATAGQSDIYNELHRHMRIVATLHREEIHILARGQFRDIAALAGAHVNIGSTGSGTNLTARNLLSRLNLRVDPDLTPTAQAISKLTQGTLDAVFYVVGKGADAFKKIQYDDATRADLHFIQIPAAQSGIDEYVPARLTHADYPNLIEEGSPVETRAVTALLAVYSWNPGDPRYPAANRFIDGFFSNAAKLVEPGSGYSRDQWCQANLAGKVAGWDRFEAADLWMATHRGAVAELRSVPGSNCPAAEMPASCADRFIEDMRRDGYIVTQPFSGRAQRDYDAWRPRNGC